MKKKVLILTGAVVASCLGGPAYAQDTPTVKAREAENLQREARPSRDRLETDRLESLGYVKKASQIIGITVENSNNEKLGKVEDLALDLEKGRVAQVIVSVGGFLGVGDRHIAVPPSAFRVEADNKIIRLEADKEKLKNAPEFKLANWDQHMEGPRVIEAYRYFEQPPYFGVEKTEIVVSPDRQLGRLERASKIIGMSVKNLQDEKLGKVEDLTVDLPRNRVVNAIISSGGFFGIAEELSIVPPFPLRFSSDRDGLILDATKDSLTKAPHFKAGNWPDINDPLYVSETYRAYKVEPYFSTRKDADNTALNYRDRGGNTRTPLDQGNSAADVQTTSKIRKEILARDGISVNARNVKIITANGRVTLRGPVRSEEEKRMIAEIAARIASPDKVDNELEVKADAVRE